MTGFCRGDREERERGGGGEGEARWWWQSKQLGLASRRKVAARKAEYGGCGAAAFFERKRKMI